MGARSGATQYIQGMGYLVFMAGPRVRAVVAPLVTYLLFIVGIWAAAFLLGLPLGTTLFGLGYPLAVLSFPLAVLAYHAIEWRKTALHYRYMAEQLAGALRSSQALVSTYNSHAELADPLTEAAVAYVTQVELHGDEDARARDFTAWDDLRNAAKEYDPDAFEDEDDGLGPYPEHDPEHDVDEQPTTALPGR